MNKKNYEIITYIINNYFCIHKISYMYVNLFGKIKFNLLNINELKILKFKQNYEYYMVSYKLLL